jgi:hypothetical protein
MSAAYDCKIQMTDDETFRFVITLLDTDGNPPDWADYTFEYSLTGDGTTLALTEGAGVTVDTDNDVIIIAATDPTYRLRAGVYQHGFRVTEDATDITTQYFDGTVTVTEGNFA